MEEALIYKGSGDVQQFFWRRVERDEVSEISELAPFLVRQPWIGYGYLTTLLATVLGSQNYSYIKTPNYKTCVEKRHIS